MDHTLSATYSFTADVWLYQGKAAWHFVTLPPKLAGEIRFMAGSTRKGFGSVPVTAGIGTSSWKTSIFPDSKSASYLLPLKASIRQKEQIDTGQSVRVSLTLHA
jgi:hypothetical protein